MIENFVKEVLMQYEEDEDCEFCGQADCIGLVGTCEELLKPPE